jgi:hypothetical protein
LLDLKDSAYFSAINDYSLLKTAEEIPGLFPTFARRKLQGRAR